MGAWARRFVAADRATYCFGLADSGYVSLGRLVLDRRQDCISLMYRTTELARAPTAATPWPGPCAPASPARPRRRGGPAGRVDYDDPAHLDYSLDMVRSGWWGDDVTATLTGVRPDSLGTAALPGRLVRLGARRGAGAVGTARG